MEHVAFPTAFMKGKQIFLREVRLSDVDDNYYRWLNDPDVTQYLEIRHIPRSRENIGKYVTAMDGNPDEILLAICLKENGRHIGNIKLGPVNWIHRFAEVSLMIGEKTLWRKGIATEAIFLITRYAFDVLNLNKLRAGCYESNIGSSKAFLKVGFLQEGALKNHWYVNGSYQNEIVLGLCREDFRDRPGS
ncbi:MAG: GNAT family N-acetyltransferase [Deltaproteobacteria bacterium]|nr:GNAT family N-acetyltransferase [Deltaproteobacteria bacterium]